MCFYKGIILKGLPDKSSKKEIGERISGNTNNKKQVGDCYLVGFSCLTTGSQII